MPGGASGVLLKSKAPKMLWCAESVGLVFDARKRLIVSWACGRRRSHALKGKDVGQVASPVMKWF